MRTSSHPRSVFPIFLVWLKQRKRAAIGWLPSFSGLGLKGEVAPKLGYAWEHNSVTNCNNDTMQPYMYTAMMNQPQAAYVQWMAGNNPNYNVHLLGGTVSFAW